MNPIDHYAKIGYDAYGDNADWKNYQGKPMPTWDELPENIKESWRVSTKAIMDASRPR